MMDARAQEGNITIVNNVDNRKPVIVADRRAVMQILLNVLSNAVKFTPAQGLIKVNIDEFDNHLSIKIIDTGIGIPANKLSAVLKPFEQVSTALTRNHEGSGLGLAITKELAELHGGMLSLESSEGNGTTVAIRLPKNALEKQKKS
jgi:signal transduction histidine kinase